MLQLRDKNCTLCILMVKKTDSNTTLKGSKDKNITDKKVTYTHNMYSYETVAKYEYISKSKPADCK